MEHHPSTGRSGTRSTARQAGLAQGDSRALRFAPDYGLFAAAADESAASLAALAAPRARRTAQVALVEAVTPAIVPRTSIVSTAVIWQMVAPRS